MLELQLKLPAKGTPSTHLTAVVEEMKRLETQKVKVFRTICDSRSKEIRYIFTTTSKDIHLGLGTISGSALEHLGILIHELYESGHGDDEILVTRADDKSAMLVTVTKYSNTALKFTLAPAH